MNKEEKRVVEKFFANFPVCHAIPRANEALAIRTVKLLPPILDLGCGDGRFALFTFGRTKIEVGLDKDSKEATKAKKTGTYKKAVVGDAANIPLANESFASVIANSVLEHVKNLDKALTEVARILQKSGLFVLTVPTPLVSRYQFWAKFIPGYTWFKKRLWRHINYFGKGQWQKKLKKAGFKLVSVRKTNSKSALSWADVFFPLWMIGPIKQVLPFLERRKVFGFDKEGATLLIVAKKNEASQN